MFPTPPVMISFVVSLYTPLMKDTVKIIILSCLDMLSFTSNSRLTHYSIMQLFKIPLDQPLAVSRTAKLFAPCAD